MPSPWKNLLPKRKYRERRQLTRRSHLGILEKKQDYRRRVDDFHKKEKTMEKLREKVLNKNPDEFYHGMINAKMINGEHKIKGIKAADDNKKNLKLLDITRMIQKKKAEKLQSSLHLLDIEKANTHTFFVQSKQQIKRKVKELEKEKEKQKEKKDEANAKIAFEQFGGDLNQFEEFYNQSQKEKKKKYHSLATSLQRERLLGQMTCALEFDQKLKGKGKKRKIVNKETGKSHYEWFVERKK